MEFTRLSGATGQAAQLTALLHAAYAADEALQIHFGAAKVRAEVVAQHIINTPTFVLTDEQQNLIATVSVRLPWGNDPGPFKLPHLGWIATNPEYQHHGYAKQIITLVIEQYIKETLNAPAVSLGTALEHPWLRQAYQSLGFIHVATVRKFPDHQTAYLVKILNKEQALKLNDSYFQTVLAKPVNNP